MHPCAAHPYKGQNQPHPLASTIDVTQPNLHDLRLDFLLCALVAPMALFLLWTSPAAAQNKLEVIRTVVLDPGHGGENEGTHSVTGLQEKDTVLQVAHVVQKRLQEDYPGLQVVLTRTTDQYLSLPERIHRAHNEGADLFLSLHMNASSNKQATGIEVFYLKANKATSLDEGKPGSWGKEFSMPDMETPLWLTPGVQNQALPMLLDDLERGRAHQDSAELAVVLLEELLRACPGRKSRGVRQDNFGVLRGAKVPAVVVEFGFLSNRQEERWLLRPETHQRFGKAISRTVARLDALFVRKGYTNTLEPH